ncbi:hypothetical protein Zmor_025169 [Zophobas morio]|uniref:Uncharacterized protein n=1 Tax=Zophobas morio TaxID=2755281 RepID=A0AA38HR74_9CUCU|nr:hypothetical protein Zmor_025169 [Zophobas morio]
MDNITLQLEPFGRLNLDELDEVDDTYYYYFDGWDIVAKTLELAIVGASECACFAMIYVITKFDYLKTRTNLYILHYSLTAMLFYITTIIYELLIPLGIYDIGTHFTLCLFYKIGGTALTLMFTFSTMLSLDWVLFMFDVSWLERYSQIQKYIIGGIYILYIAQYIDSVVPCFGLSRIFTHDFIIIEYLVMVVVVVTANLITCCKKLSEECAKYRYFLKISTYILLSWLPFLILFFVVTGLLRAHTMYIAIDDFFENLIKFTTGILPAVTAFWLDSCDSKFRQAFRAVFCGSQDQEFLDDGDENTLIGNEELPGVHNIV